MVTPALSSASQTFYQQASGSTSAGNGRGLNKYGSDLNVRSAANTQWAFLACSGAVINNVRAEADGGSVQLGADGYREIHTQLSYRWVDYGTDLVTISVGGNDAGFAGILFTCATSSCHSASNEPILNAAIDGLGPQLQRLYDSIQAQTFGARVIVLGYPQLFPATAAEQSCRSLRVFAGEQDYLRRATTRMNTVIAQAASRAGVDYVDVSAGFAGHGVCGARGEWINGLSGTETLLGEASTMSHSTRRWWVSVSTPLS
ncbi:SGNH/GDSL hydrolase family protein [Geodermatophilus sp. SYSU D01119]